MKTFQAKVLCWIWSCQLVLSLRWQLTLRSCEGFDFDKLDILDVLDCIFYLPFCFRDRRWYEAIDSRSKIFDSVEEFVSISLVLNAGVRVEDRKGMCLLCTMPAAFVAEEAYRTVTYSSLHITRGEIWERGKWKCEAKADFVVLLVNGALASSSSNSARRPTLDRCVGMLQRPYDLLLGSLDCCQQVLWFLTLDRSIKDSMGIVSCRVALNHYPSPVAPSHVDNSFTSPTFELSLSIYQWIWTSILVGSFVRWNVWVSSAFDSSQQPHLHLLTTFLQNRSNAGFHGQE